MTTPDSTTDRERGRVLTALSALRRDQLTVFAGPSLVDSPFREAAAHLTVPPIQDGDLARLTCTAPVATALVVDGYFGAGQAVNLTEIQETIRRGIRLYGCSSMGALRAVEAAPWGMTGLGAIYDSYRRGVRTEDENVALLHDDTYRPLTVPTVNLDALCVLLNEGGVPTQASATFRDRAAELYFGDRSFTALRALARKHLSKHADIVASLLEPAERGRWDVKRQDAENALTALVLGRAPMPAPGSVVPVPENVESLLRVG